MDLPFPTNSYSDVIKIHLLINAQEKALLFRVRTLATTSSANSFKSLLVPPVCPCQTLLSSAGRLFCPGNSQGLLRMVLILVVFAT